MAGNASEFLLFAADNGWTEDVKAALEAGADIDFDQLENWSPGEDTTLPPCTPLFIACLRGYVDVVKLLLREGASLVKRTMGVLAPLHAAASNGYTEVVELLVYHGATVDIRDGFQNTPLMAACLYKHADTVRRLIELGAGPDLTDENMAPRLGIEDENRASVEKCVKLIQEARKTKLLRCCNPKCGKPGYRKTLKLCAQCKMTRYCSRDCQKQHWSVGHKKCCGYDAYSVKGPDRSKHVQLGEKMLLYMEEHVQ